MNFQDPFEIVTLFEKKIADYAGAPFGVAVDCATHAVELSLRYLSLQSPVTHVPLDVPRHTYPSIPMTALRLGHEVRWTDERWTGEYSLAPLPVVDASVRFRKGMYKPGTFYCLSFQAKKRLSLGRGGMILTDDPAAHAWLVRASYDGRARGVPWKEQLIEIAGFHYYMTPECAARGLLLFDGMKDDYPDLGSWKDYPDLSRFPVFGSQMK